MERSLPEVCKLAMVIQLVKCGFRIQKRQFAMHKDDLGSSLGSPKNAKVGSQETPKVTGKFGLGVQN